MGTALLCGRALKCMWIIDIFTAVLISSEFSSLFFFLPLPSLSIFFSHRLQSILPLAKPYILHRFMRTFVSYFLFSHIVKTDCQRSTDWVESPHRLSCHCQAPHIHLWGGFNRASGPMAFLPRLFCYWYEVRGRKIVDSMRLDGYIS